MKGIWSMTYYNLLPIEGSSCQNATQYEDHNLDIIYADLIAGQFHIFLSANA